MEGGGTKEAADPTHSAAKGYGDEEEDACTLGDEHLSRDLQNALGKKGIRAGPTSPGGARPARRARKPRRLLYINTCMKSGGCGT